MIYAVIKSGGKQYRVSEGMVLTVAKIDTEKDKKHVFSEVLLVKDGDVVKIGKPFIEGLSVEATVLEQGKGEKIRVSQFKAKARHRRVTGFRPQLTTVKIEAIGEKKKTEKAEKEVVKKPRVKAKAKK